MVSMPSGGGEAEADIDEMCEDLLQAMVDLSYLFNPYYPYQGALFQSCVEIRNRVNRFLHQKEEESQDIMGKVIALGGGQVGLSASDKARLELHFHLFSQSYNTYLEQFPNPLASGTLGKHPDHRWTWKDKSELLPKSTLELDQVYHQEDGAFTYERSLIHHTILRYQSRFGLPADLSVAPNALIFVGGSPVDHYLLTRSLQENEGTFVEVNPEEMTWQLPEYRLAMGLKRDSTGAMEAVRNAYEICQEEVQYLCSSLLQEAAKEHQNLLFLRWDLKPKDVKQLHKYLSQHGFRPQVILLDESLDTLMERSIVHTAWTGTYQSDKTLKAKHEKLQEWIPEIAQTFSRIMLYNWDGDMPQLVWLKEGKKSKAYLPEYVEQKGWTFHE